MMTLHIKECSVILCTVGVYGISIRRDMSLCIMVNLPPLSLVFSSVKSGILPRKV